MYRQAGDRGEASPEQIEVPTPAQVLLGDDEAINRMASRLLAESSFETPGMADVGNPRALVIALLRAADDARFTPTGFVARWFRQQAEDRRESPPVAEQAA